MKSDDFEPMAENPYDRLGISPDASPTEFKRASIKARAKYNPDKYTGDKKSWARERLFRIQDAIEAIDTGAASSYEESRSSDSDKTETGESTDSDDGGTDDSDVVHLNISATSDRVTVFESVSVTVLDNNGEPISGVELNSPGTEPVITDGNGLASLSFDTAGTYTVTADKTGGDCSFVSDSVTVEVERETVELNITADTYSFPVDDSVVVEAFIDGEDGTASSVRFETSKGREYFAATGRKRLSFEESGGVEVSVTKPETETLVFEPDSISFDVEPKEIDLSLDIDPTEVDAGEPVYIRVLDSDNESVPNTKIVTDSGDEHILSDGTGKITFDEVGDKSLTASVNDPDISASTTASIHVRSDDKTGETSKTTDDDTGAEKRSYEGMFATDPKSDSGGIRVKRSTDKIAVDETIEFSVLDLDDETIDEIKFEILETGETGETNDGVWSYSHDEEGLYTVLASVETDEGTVESQAKFSIEDTTEVRSEDPTFKWWQMSDVTDSFQSGSIKILLFTGVIGLMILVTAPMVFDVVQVILVVAFLSIIVSIGVVSMALS